MKFLIAPDKFKGSLTATEVCEAIAKGIKKCIPDATIIQQPMADGGEGSLDILIDVLGLDKVLLTVNDPLFRPVKSYYGVKDRVAYIELAKASGLGLLSQNERNPMNTTTYGTGQMIRDAVKKGINQIVLFVGGSATNDGGIGIAHALGYRFFDKNKMELVPVGKNMIHVSTIEDTNEISDILNNVSVKICTDVTNELYGRHGAAFQYGRQKGASDDEIIQLDRGLRNLESIFNSDSELNSIVGMGAAGGVSVALISLLNSRIISGIQYLLELTNTNEIIQNVDVVITGEGKIDQQTLSGKVVKGMSALAKNNNKPCFVFCGINDLTEKEMETLSIERIICIHTSEYSKDFTIKNASYLLTDKTYELIKYILEG